MKTIVQNLFNREPFKALVQGFTGAHPFMALAHVSLILALIGLLDMPSGYYRATKLYFTITSIAMGIQVYGIKPFIGILCGVAALFYNPIYKIYLDEKSLWTICDMATVTLHYVGGYVLYRSQMALAAKASQEAEGS